MLARRIWALVGLILICGCSGGDSPLAKSDTPTTSGPSPASAAAAASGTSPAGSALFITAAPNPVHVVAGQQGKTTIQWQTGDGSLAEVYLAAGKKPEELFAGGNSHGSSEVNWISKGGKYEFLLYAGKEHKTKLASVIVTTD